jgi:SAM-dependent methyltransferase
MGRHSSRRQSKGEGGAYVFPRHPTEVDRLDLQHYALHEAIGANYLAPVEAPARILDVGQGSGQWAFDLCVEFPKAVVVGFDLVSGKPTQLGGYRFVRGNLLEGLPFVDGRFDFVHQRLLTSGVPLKSWLAAVEDLVRVTQPGGWVELAEVGPGVEPMGPATTRLFELGWRLGRLNGLDMTGIVWRSLDGYLVRTGLTGVEKRTFEVPIGEWGDSVGSFMASDLRALFTRLSPVFQARFDVPAQECAELIAAMLQEFEQHQSAGIFNYAFGRKPGRGAGES